jgi:hypothetical protein
VDYRLIPAVAFPDSVRYRIAALGFPGQPETRQRPDADFKTDPDDDAIDASSSKEVATRCGDHLVTLFEWQHDSLCHIVTNLLAHLATNHCRIAIMETGIDAGSGDFGVDRIDVGEPMRHPWCC